MIATSIGTNAFGMRGKTAAARVADRWIPESYTEFKRNGNTVVYVYDGETNPDGSWRLKPCAMGFKGNGGNNTFHHSFTSIAARNLFICNWWQRNTVEKVRRISQPTTLKVGDIVYNSWGYDQTNIDFYIVEKATAKQVVIREIGSSQVPGSEGFMCANVVPDATHRGSKVLRAKSEGDRVRFEFGSGNKWMGQTLYNSWYA